MDHSSSQYVDGQMHPGSRMQAQNTSQRNHPGRLSRWLAVGAALGGAALYVRQRSQQAERENPPNGKFVEVDGVRLHYTERGEGQPVVLLHGNTTMGLDFELSGLVDLAAENYRVIVFDRPGYGHSERPRTTIWGPHAQARLLLKAIEIIGAEKPVIVGHSWGALVAVAMDLESPESIRSLVLISGYYFPTMRPDVPLAAQPAIPVIGGLMRYTVSPLMFRMLWPGVLKRMFSPAAVPEKFKRFPAWMALRPFQLRASAAEIAMVVPSTMKLSKHYRELRVPRIIMAGSGDRLVHTHQHSQRLYAELPDSDIRILRDVGHMVHHIAPEKVMEAIDDAARLGDQQPMRKPELAALLTSPPVR